MSDVADRVAMAEHGYVIDGQGLHLTRELHLDEWRALGVEIARRVEGAAWALGDWLVAGGRRRDRMEPDGQWFTGSIYAEALQITGYDRGHLANCYSVSTAYPRGKRFALRWSHHREALRVKNEDQRRAVLEQAVAKRWTVQDLSDQLDRIVTPAQTRLTMTPHTRQRDRVQCPACAEVFEVRGHKVPRVPVPVKPNGRPQGASHA